MSKSVPMATERLQSTRPSIENPKSKIETCGRLAALSQLQAEIVACRACLPVAWRESVAQTKRRGLPRLGIFGQAHPRLGRPRGAGRSWSGWPPARTAPTAPGGPSPATVPACFCSPRCTAPVSPASPPPSTATTTCACSTATSPGWAAVRRRRTAPPPPNWIPAGPSWRVRLRCCPTCRSCSAWVTWPLRARCASCARWVRPLPRVAFEHGALYELGDGLPHLLALLSPQPAKHEHGPPHARHDGRGLGAGEIQTPPRVTGCWFTPSGATQPTISC